MPFSTPTQPANSRRPPGGEAGARSPQRRPERQGVLVKQHDFFSDSIDQRTENFLRIFFRDEDFAKPRARDKVADGARPSTRRRRAEAEAGPGLSETGRTPEAILNLARSRMDGTQGPAGTASLFEADARIQQGISANGGPGGGRGARAPLEALERGEAGGGPGQLKIPEPIDSAADPEASVRASADVKDAPDALRPEDAEEALKGPLRSHTTCY